MMKNGGIFSIALLYETQAELEQFIEEHFCHVTDCTAWLVQIHTCCHTPDSAVAIAKHVAQKLPHAKILGTSASAVIYHGAIYDDRCVLIFTGFSQTEVTACPLSFSGKTPQQLAGDAALHIPADCKGIFAFFTDQYMQMQPFLTALERQGLDIPVAGGMISSNLFGSFAFDASGVYHHTLLLGILHGDSLRTWNGTVQGQESFGEIHTVTKAREDVLLEIDHRPAKDWFRSLSREIGQGEEGIFQDDFLLHFPLLLEREGKPSRFLRYDEPCACIKTYADWLSEGTTFRTAYLSPLTAVAQLREYGEALEITPCEVIYAFFGTLHRTTMPSCTQWELQSFRGCRICGVFLYGEICPLRPHNVVSVGVGTLFGLAERQAYLPIDKTSLENLRGIDEDRNSAEEYIARLKQGTHVSRVTEQILQQESALRSSTFLDQETELENLVKFKFDDRKHRFNKICMISIEKGILISGRRGTKVWNQLMRENIQQVIRTLHDTELSFYCNDTWSFFFAANPEYPDDKFLSQAELAFHECGYYFCKELNITAVNVFHVVIGETNLLEKVQLCMSAVKDHNARFFVYNRDDVDSMKQMDEKLWMTNIISDAILYDRIVPYFQPIRDNRTKEITKYEALMRLSDKDHNIYAPGQFLEIAKDYHLYLQLSQLMIRKVLELFRDRKESVFLNLSAYDIGSAANRTLLYELLGDLPPEACRRITFEILESEKIRDFEELVDFLNELRKFGVKIAIDDFGSGFSNFTAILRVNPDFIKIDGDLIINCDKEPMKQVCLHAISDIAKGMDAELIAEHVENSMEQETVESANIEYTQGYYFSKPVPYQDLKQENQPQ